MLRLIWLACVVGVCLTTQSVAQPAKDVTVTDLAMHPQKFNGHLVRVKAVLVFGWEGDNFLLDPSKPSPVQMPSHDPASVWFYCRPIHEKQVYGPIAGRRLIYGSFEGYFHFVRETHMVNGVFEPGSLQFEAMRTSIPDHQPPSLAEATMRADVDETRRLLQSDPNIRERYGSVLLFLAAKSGRADFAQELLAGGADTKPIAPGADVVLAVAAWNCSLEVARALLSHSALVNAANVHGETALINASQTCTDGKMVRLLLAAGADPNAKTTNGATALIAAAGNPMNVEALLKAGADPSAKDESGETVETLSCDRGAKGYYEVCQLVRKALQNSATHSQTQ